MGNMADAAFPQVGVSFSCSDEVFTARWGNAVEALSSCIDDAPDGGTMLIEGGPYVGCWLESTGTISAEILSRFMPDTARATFGLYPRFQREDGLLPYKVVAGGPAYRHIQLVTPPARSVWNHYCLTDRDRAFLERQYETLSRYDDWLAQNRDSRGNGGVEAVGAYDTGHDLSPRFWHTADTSFLEDPACSDPDNPLVPFVAPDLTASVACSRRYLAKMAHELGRPDAEIKAWEGKAELSYAALRRQCFDEEDKFYYDCDRSGRFIKVQSDVLLRVYAAEAGDHAEFATALGRYLLNTRKFFARYPFTSIALDDPRYDPHQEYNQWAGTSNFLSLVRSPHAFEYHNRNVELTWVMQPILGAFSRTERFPQNLNPWNGDPGFTEVYSPSILCMLDFVERICGIVPRSDDTLWFTGLTPSRIEGTTSAGVSTTYTRNAGGHVFQLDVSRPDQSADGTATVQIDGEIAITFPRGMRLVTDVTGAPIRVVGLVPRTVTGRIEWDGNSQEVSLTGNQSARIVGTAVEVDPLPGGIPGVVLPVTDQQ